MTDRQADLLQGTLDLLILKTLALGPQHGWGVSQRIQQMSRDVLQVNQGSLYPALHRLEHRGWIMAEWGTSENNRALRIKTLSQPRHFYSFGIIRSEGGDANCIGI